MDLTTPRVDTPWKEVFVGALRRTLSVARAADVALISYQMAARHRLKDPAFAKAWNDAVEAGCDDIEEALKKRAVRGYLKPIYWRGKRIGFERKFDTTAAMFLLRGRRKKVFGDAKSIVTINHGGTSLTAEAMNDKKLEGMSPEELEKSWEDRCKFGST